MSYTFYCLCPRQLAVAAAIAAALPALFSPLASYGAADPTDVLQFNLSAGVLRDRNLYRLPDGDSRLFGIPPDKRADTIEDLGIALRVDKTLSRQRFVVDVKADQMTYRQNDRLDHVAIDGNARWLWQIGNPWDGEISYNYRHLLSGFADLNSSIKNLVTVEQYAFEGGYRPHPRWRLWGSANYLETSNSAVTQKTNNIELTTGSLGVDYRTPSDNTVGLQLRHAEGLFPLQGLLGGPFISNDYNDSEAALVWAWQTTGKTRFSGRLGYLTRHHEELPARDFSGLVGRATFAWEPTGKLQVKATAWRELRTYQSQTSSYVLADGVELAPTWAVTSKVSLQAAITYETRDYLGDPGVVFGFTPREDKLRTYRLIAQYSPIRNVDINLALEKSSRDSNQPSNKFDDETAFLSLRFSF